MSANETLRALSTIHQKSFSEILESLLYEAGRSKSELHSYLIRQGFEIEKTSMYRYFNVKKRSGRIPDKGFLRHFSLFVGLSPSEEKALTLLWHMKRQRRRLN